MLALFIAPPSGLVPMRIAPMTTLRFNPMVKMEVSVDGVTDKDPETFRAPKPDVRCRLSERLRRQPHRAPRATRAVNWRSAPRACYPCCKLSAGSRR